VNTPDRRRPPLFRTGQRLLFNSISDSVETNRSPWAKLSVSGKPSIRRCFSGRACR
jgi:hypothetical protein